jgi:hypothetical protein
MARGRFAVPLDVSHRKRWQGRNRRCCSGCEGLYAKSAGPCQLPGAAGADAVGTMASPALHLPRMLLAVSAIPRSAKSAAGRMWNDPFQGLGPQPQIACPPRTPPVAIVPTSCLLVATAQGNGVDHAAEQHGGSELAEAGTVQR